MKQHKSNSYPVVGVGLLGLGTVGGGVAEILASHGALIAAQTGVKLEVRRALVRRARIKRCGAAAAVAVTTDPAKIIGAPDIDVVVELIGGLRPARDWILAALAAGQPVVTANKAVLAVHGKEIFRAAERAGRDVFFEAAVAGGIPIIRTLREGLAGDRISQVIGILNGTTNFILDAMAKGKPYDAALADAQALGFAEADPTLDVNGRDAADKLAILTQIAYGTVVAPARMPVEGITDLTAEVVADAHRLGYRVKLLGIAQRVGPQGGGLDVRVHPTFVPETHVLAAVPANQNAIAVNSDALGWSLYQGAGAGGLPTGSAVVADLVEVARNLRAGINGRVTPPRPTAAPKVVAAAAAQSAYYVRLQVREEPGVLAAVTRILAREKVSLATVLQLDGRGPTVPVVLTAHPATRAAMSRAIGSIARLACVRAKPQVVAILPG